VHSKFQTPANALVCNAIIGIIILFTGKTAEIIVISVFGAITLYIFSMLSVLKLRRSEPNLDRPFRVPLYPFTPIIALVLAIVCLIAMCLDNAMLAMIYTGTLVFFFLIYKLIKQ